MGDHQSNSTKQDIFLLPILLLIMGRVSPVIILISLFSALDCKDFSECGRTVENKGEGYDALAGEFPHMCSIYRLHDGFNVFLGGASLVSPDKVITLASAVKNYKVSEESCQSELGAQYDLFVECGSLDLQNSDEEGEQTRKVTGVLVHPDFNEKSLINDVAVLIVGEEFEYTKRVGPVCLPDPGEDVKPGTQCVATGHGKNEDGQFGYFSNQLKKVNLPIWSSEDCEASLNENYFQPNHSISWRTHESFLCAGGEEMQDTCEGDGGGPLVCSSSSLKAPPPPSPATPEYDPVFPENSEDPIFAESDDVDDSIFPESDDIFGDESNYVNTDYLDLREVNLRSSGENYLIQYGITAWGIGCARPGIPSVYSSLASPAVRCWLEQVMSCTGEPREEESTDYIDLRTVDSDLDCGLWLNTESGKKVAACGCNLNINTNTIEGDYDLRTSFDLRTVEEK